MKIANKIMVVALSFMSFLTLADIVEEKEEYFEVGSSATIMVHNVNGDLTIQPGRDGEIKVLAKIIAEDQTTRDRIKVLMEQESDVVSVKTEYKKNNGFNQSGSSEVKYTIWVPEGVSVVNTKLVNGDLDISAPVSKLSAKLVNGDIKSKSISNNVKLSTVNGDMTLTLAESSSSDSIALKTVNGAIDVSLPGDADYAISAETTHGRIKNDFGLTVTKGRYVGSYLKGNLGNGTGTANISSVNGSIKISQM